MTKQITSFIRIALLLSASPAFAGQFYIGGSAFLQTMSAKDSNYLGIDPQFSVGYTGMAGKYRLSGEVFAVPVAGTVATSISNFGLNTKPTYSVGASFIPGMPYGEDKTLFLRLGIVSTRFPAAATSGTGVQLGVGFLKPITPKWGLRTEYVYTAYTSIAGLGSVHSHELGLGVIYQFE